MRIKSKRFALFAMVVIAVCAIGFGAAFVLQDDAKKSEDNPIAFITQPESTSTTSSPVPELTLPQPQNSPADEYEDVPIVEIGSIEIPKIGLNTTMYEGVWLTVLNHGPGHWPGTADAGGYGNMVVAGHRVTHSKPFRNLDDLVNGDEIKVTTSAGSFTYKVTGHEIVYPKDIWIVDQNPGYKITLFACHPPGSAAQRYVIYGELVNPPTPVKS